MPSRSRLILPGATLLVLALVPGLPTAVFAGEPPASTDTATVSEKTTVSETAVSEKEGEKDRVYVTNGATISWDLNRRRFQPPTSDQAAVLARSFRAWAEAQLADEKGVLPFTKEIVVEELPGGMRKARLPIHMMNAATVRVGAQGELAGMCTEGPAGAARTQTLSTPAPKNGEVWQ